jgi:ketosteroid isomerase-like protein
MVTRSVEDIARLMEEAARESPEAMDTVGHGFWADEGAVVGHTPPAPMDGLMQREPVLEAHRRLTRAIREAMPDFHHENVHADIDGQVIQFAYDYVATQADGTRLSATVNIRLAVQKGCITEVTTAFDHEAMGRFLKLGLTAPQLASITAGAGAA